MSRTILVIGAHPDDEVLGVGGTLARHTEAGDEVQILLLADGVSSRVGSNVGSESAARGEAARGAAEVLGARPPTLLGLPDNRLDTLPILDIVQAIEDVVARTAPEIVYTHHGSDLNLDHRIAHQAVVTACRPLPGSAVRAIYAFETVSSTEWSTSEIGARFAPNRFVSIAEHLAIKSRAIAAYDSEIRPFPHARSREAIEALARLRGSQVGLEAAEAFHVIREIEP